MDDGDAGWLPHANFICKLQWLTIASNLWSRGNLSGLIYKMEMSVGTNQVVCLLTLRWPYWYSHVLFFLARFWNLVWWPVDSVLVDMNLWHDSIYSHSHQLTAGPFMWADWRPKPVANYLMMKYASECEAKSQLVSVFFYCYSVENACWHWQERTEQFCQKWKKRSALFCAEKASQFEDTVTVLNSNWAQSITLKDVH